MPRRAEPVEKIADMDRYFNRQRFVDETTLGLHQLLRSSGKDKAWLAKRLGHTGRSAITKAFRGDNNFKLETLADIAMSLGRYVHVVWWTDPDEVRFPRDTPPPNIAEVSAPRSSDSAETLSTTGNTDGKAIKASTTYGQLQFTGPDGSVRFFPTSTQPSPKRSFSRLSTR